MERRVTERLINRNHSKSYIDISIVCDKCGKLIIRDEVYGFGHQCEVYLKELNKKYENIDDSKKRRQARDYANAMYHPKVIYKIP